MTLRGSRREGAAGLHVLSAYATVPSAVVGDLMVEPDASEITAAIALLKALPLKGAVITGDAIFAQREISRHIREGGGHFLFTVKSLPRPDRGPTSRRRGATSRPPSATIPPPAIPPPDLAEAKTV